MEYSYEEPTDIRSGETVTWKKTDFSAYPQSDGFTAKYSISGLVANTPKVITGAFANGEWTFELTATNNTLGAGSCILYGFITKGAGAAKETYPIYDPTPLIVAQSYETGVATDVRSHAQKMLDLIETTLQSFATDGINTVDIAGRSYTRENISELYALRNKYSRRVHGTTFQTIPVTFPIAD